MRYARLALVGACIFTSSFAMAQTPAVNEKTDEKPAITMPEIVNSVELVAGANSYTEDQAKGRLEEAGFTEVADLMLSKEGFWTGTAILDGKKMNVKMDYKGNIATTDSM